MATLWLAVPGKRRGSVSCRLREQSLVKELRPRDVLESSSDSDEKAPAAKPSSLPKRKLELEGEAVEKKKKGRPRKDARLLPMALSMQVSLAGAPPGRGRPTPRSPRAPQGSCLVPTAACPSVPCSCPAVLREEKPGLQAQPRSGTHPRLALPSSAGTRSGTPLLLQSPAALTAEKDTVCVSIPAPALKLPMPGPQRAFTLQVSSPWAASRSGPRLWLLPRSPPPSGALWLIRAATRSYGAAGLLGDPVACPPRPAAPLGAQLLKTHPRGPFSQKPPRSWLWALGSVPGGPTRLRGRPCRTPDTGGREGV